MRRLWFGVLFSFTLLGQAVGLELDFTDINGKRLSLADQEGRWVIVNFWATWCPPCLEEIPDLAQFHDEHKDKDAVVWGINYEDIDKKRLQRFIDDYFINYPVVQLHPDQPSPLGSVPALPTTYVIAPTGEVVARQVGLVSSDVLEEFMERWEAENN